MAKDDILEQAFNHVVLPPKLPGKQDSNIAEVERKLLSLLSRGANVVESCAGNNDIWQDVEKALKTCSLVNDSDEERYVNKTALEHAFRDFGNSDIIILHIAEQNAGLLIRGEE